MPLLEFITTSSLGSLLGMRHALEPDHLAAVSTLVTGERSSSKAAWLGACWGIGHTFNADDGRRGARDAARRNARLRRRPLRARRCSSADRPVFLVMHSGKDGK